MPGKAEQIHFVTGRLAEHALRRTLDLLAPRAGFTFTLEVLPITVAALMTPQWIERHVHVPPGTSRVLIPGYCGGDLSALAQAAGVRVERGPRDLRQLHEFFGAGGTVANDVGAYSIQIIAEINHAPQLQQAEILRQARRLVADGADIIDVGCEPGDPWLGVGDCVKTLRDAGCRVSLDSFHPTEVELAVRAGAELVLSVNSTNRDAATDWGCEVVAIPDNLQLLDRLDETVEFLAKKNVPFRIDPILEPIGCGFAGSLWRYLDIRRRYPDSPMMMGIGNLTEMTDADSAAINVLLVGFCQEAGIGSVLTTQVINWARSSVRECDIARRLAYYAVSQRVPPKHVTTDLVILRDNKLQPFGAEQLDELAGRIKDHNVRIFAEDGQIHVLRSGKRLSDADPFALFERLETEFPDHMDPSHAFYLGYEMCKALTALTLSKEYRQDESLEWGYLTVAEDYHRLERRNEY
jgi:dihydropteroate synthase-like protein